MVHVDADVSNLVVALALVAGAAFLVALLGVRFTRITAGSVGLDAATVGEASEEEASTKAQEFKVTENKVDLDEVDLEASSNEWSKLPDWAKKALVNWADEGTVLTRPLRHAILSSAKEPGKGSRAWYVKVLLDDGNTRTLKVTTGRGSTNVAHDEDFE